MATHGTTISTFWSGALRLNSELTRLAPDVRLSQVLWCWRSSSQAAVSISSGPGVQGRSHRSLGNLSNRQLGRRLLRSGQIKNRITTSRPPGEPPPILPEDGQHQNSLTPTLRRKDYRLSLSL